MQITRPVASVRLDWKAYFKRFCEIHGEPVRHGGRLLFRDGFTYAAKDYAGPEWPPPENEKERLRLIRAYWGHRRSLVTYERDRLQRLLDSLEQAQSSRSVPLQQIKNVYVESEDGRSKHSGQERVDLDLTDLQGRISWLEADIDQCDEQLEMTHGSP